MTSRAGVRVASDESQARQDFRPGRSVHWIQAKKAGEDLADAEAGRIVEVTTREAVVEVHGRRRRYGVVDANGLREAIERYGAKVLVQESWSILRLRNHLISIRRDEPYTSP